MREIVTTRTSFVNSVVNDRSDTIRQMHGRGASLMDLRVNNEARILEYIRRNPGSTQLEIADAVDLTRAAVSKLIGAGEAGGRSGGGLQFALDSTPEERPKRHFLKVHLGVVISLDLGMNHIRIRIADLGGRELEPILKRIKYPVSQNPREALRKAGALVIEALETAKLYKRPFNGDPTGKPLPITPDTIAGMAIGAPYPVTDDGQVLGSPRWRFEQLPSSLWKYMPGREVDSVAIQSDANLGAWAEFEATLENPAGIANLTAETLSIVYVKWSTDVSGGIVTSGHQHIGYGGLGAQFTHVELPSNGTVHAPDECEQCERHCVAQNASLSAIIKRLAPLDPAKLGDDAQERADALVALAEKDQTVMGAIEDAADQLGQALGLALNSLNPRFLIIGGAFDRESFEAVEPALHAGLEKTTHPAILEHVIVRPGLRTGKAAVVGGLTRALHEFGVQHVLQNRPTANRSPQRARQDSNL